MSNHHPPPGKHAPVSVKGKKKVAGLGELEFEVGFRPARRPPPPPPPPAKHAPVSVKGKKKVAGLGELEFKVGFRLAAAKKKGKGEKSAKKK